jgi:uncharacterized protein
MLLCDTGVLLAAGNVKDHAHQACLKLLRQAQGPLLVPSPVLGEIGYLLQSRVGPLAEVTFLNGQSALLPGGCVPVGASTATSHKNR